VNLRRLRAVESILTDLVADTGDLAGPQRPIYAREQLLQALAQVQREIAVQLLDRPRPDRVSGPVPDHKKGP
jgi:hypothetical protein